MRALVLSDIHGNVHALEAVLAAARAMQPGFNAVWNLGDMVGYGARPNEVLELLRSLDAVHVRGNHDRVCCGLTSAEGFNPVAATAAAWTKRTLTPENLAWLRACPQGPVVPPGQADARAMCAHGSPLHEDHYIVSMRDAWVPLQRMQSELTFFGHTHVQGSFWRQEVDWEEMRPRYESAEGAAQRMISVVRGSRALINPGSVGQPRDRDWRAGFALYDEQAETATFHRVPYDVQAAQAAILAAGLPERLATRLGMGR